MTHDWAQAVIAEVQERLRKRSVRGQNIAGCVVVSPGGMMLLRAYLETVTPGGVVESLWIASLSVVSDADQQDGWEIVWDADVEAKCGV